MNSKETVITRLICTNRALSVVYIDNYEDTEVLSVPIAFNITAPIYKAIIPLGVLDGNSFLRVFDFINEFFIEAIKENTEAIHTTLLEKLTKALEKEALNTGVVAARMDRSSNE